MNFEHTDYLNFDPLNGESDNALERTVTLKWARKNRPCFMGTLPGAIPHDIQRGAMYRLELVREDDIGATVYAVCLDCMNKYLVSKKSVPN